MKKNITILEFPSNLGLYEPAPGKEPGVKHLPAWLKQHGFYDAIKPIAVQFLQPPQYSMELDKTSGVRNADNIAAYAKKQMPMIVDIIAKKNFPLAIGGDCSILIGNMLALKTLGNFGLFFLDGHTDFIWPGLSQTGGAAGMDLAIVAGRGHDKLANIDHQKPYIKEKHIWCVGNREYDDPKYILAIDDSSINYYDLRKLRSQGIQKCIEDFSLMVHREKLDGFWIHLDVDALDDDIMPAVDSRSPGGLLYEELYDILTALLENPKATGMEITILDPERDPSGKYTSLFVERMGEILNR